MAETTSLGAALAAAKTVQLWSFDTDTSKAADSVSAFHPSISSEYRDSKFMRWNEAIQRSLGWARNPV